MRRHCLRLAAALLALSTSLRADSPSYRGYYVRVGPAEYGQSVKVAVVQPGEALRVFTTRVATNWPIQVGAVLAEAENPSQEAQVLYYPEPGSGLNPGASAHGARVVFTISAEGPRVFAVPR